VKHLDEAQRSAILDQELVKIVGEGGNVLARTPTSAVVAFGEPVNHVLHLLVSVLLCGLWLPVWLLIAATGGERRMTLAIDQYGEIYDPNRSGRLSEAKTVLIVCGGVLLLVLILYAIVHH
jgi:hypothetical protein